MLILRESRCVKAEFASCRAPQSACVIWPLQPDFRLVRRVLTATATGLASMAQASQAGHTSCAHLVWALFAAQFAIGKRQPKKRTLPLS